MIVDDQKETLGLFEYAAMRHPEIMLYVNRTAPGALDTLYALNYEVDAIVTDLMMAAMDGMTFTRIVRESEQDVKHEKPIPIYWYTGWPVNLSDPLDPVTKVYTETGVKRIFKKPYEPVNLVAEICAEIAGCEELANVA
jgi:CheY-like chemotaxis protein